MALARGYTTAQVKVGGKDLGISRIFVHDDDGAIVVHRQVQVNFATMTAFVDKTKPIPDPERNVNGGSVVVKVPIVDSRDPDYEPGNPRVLDMYFDTYAVAKEFVDRTRKMN